VWTAVGFGNAQISQELGNRLGFHTGTAISVQRQCSRFDVLFDAGLLDDLFGQFTTFMGGYQPANDIAAEYIYDDVQVKIIPFLRCFQFRTK